MTQIEQLRISGQLPTPKGVALAVLELSRRENVTLAEVSRMVQSDPALSGRLIKLANTASQISRPVASVQEAVIRLGLAAVRQLTLGFSLLDNYRDGSCTAFKYQDYWSHSLLAAIAMQSLGTKTRVATPDELFTCGLLAQIGQLALATAYPDEYGAILVAYQTDASQTLVARERAQLEIDHNELSVVMMTDWGIPKALTEPLLHMENPEDAGFDAESRAHFLVSMLYLSHLLADLGLCNEAERPAQIAAVLHAAARLDINPEEAGTFIDGVIGQWHDWGQVLNIPASALPPFAEMTRAQEADAAVHPPLRIIVADSNALTRGKTVALFTQEGHTAHPAANGEEALALAMQVLPQIIIAERNLPLLDGLELCQALRATDEGKRMYFLLMTDENSDDRLIEAFEAGTDGVALKPVSDRVLCTRLHAARHMLQLQEGWEKDRTQLRHIAAELAVANRRLANAALTDMLTGLPNRRSAMDQLQQAWSAALRSGLPLAVMVIDIDNFKSVNDRYGHAAGDAVLREVAVTLRASARKQDSVCRIGGEEFLVICQNADIKAALQSGERLRKTVETKLIQIGQELRKATVSVGIAIKEADTTAVDALVSTADQALYAAKNTGRNRTCVYARK
jgi:diguanylate cyclase (GGDEF)-like protein